LVTYNYKLLCYELGAPGRESDGGVLERSQIGRDLRAGTFPIPKPRPLPQTEANMPCVIVADEAFALLTNVMRPFPSQDGCLPPLEDHFNYRLSRARRVSENFFAILAARFRMYHSPMQVATPQVAISKIKASLVLHNWLQSNTNSRAGRNVDTHNVEQGHGNALMELEDAEEEFDSEASSVRQKFAQYFQTIGTVPWDWKKY
jgi:hypothetical protein